MTITAIMPTVMVISAARPGAARSSFIDWYILIMVVDSKADLIAMEVELRLQLSVDVDNSGSSAVFWQAELP